MSAKGFAIHLGVRRYDRRDNGNFAPDLPPSMLESAEALQRFGAGRRFISPLGAETNLLLDSDATLFNLRRLVVAASEQMRAGDSLLVTFCGYGILPDIAGPHGIRGWLLYDLPLRFESLFADLCAMPKGARVVVISISCFAGWPSSEKAAVEFHRDGATVVHIAGCGGDELLSAHTTFAFDLVAALDGHDDESFAAVLAKLPRSRGATPQIAFVSPRDSAFDVRDALVIGGVRREAERSQPA